MIVEDETPSSGYLLNHVSGTRDSRKCTHRLDSRMDKRPWFPICAHREHSNSLIRSHTFLGCAFLRLDFRKSCTSNEGWRKLREREFACESSSSNSSSKEENEKKQNGNYDEPEVRDVGIHCFPIS